MIRHYKSKHTDRELPEGLLSSIPNMSQEELTAALSKLGGISYNSTGGALNLSNDRGDSDDTQDFEVKLKCDVLVLNSLVYRCGMKKTAIDGLKYMTFSSGCTL